MAWLYHIVRIQFRIYCVTDYVFAIHFLFRSFFFFFLVLHSFQFHYFAYAFVSVGADKYRKCNEHYSPFVCLVFDLLHSKTTQHKLQWNKLRSAYKLGYTINQHNCIERPSCQNNKKREQRKHEVHIYNNRYVQTPPFVRFFSTRAVFALFIIVHVIVREQFLFCICVMKSCHSHFWFFFNKKSPECIL